MIARAGGVPLDDAAHFALHPGRLLELAWPGAFGEPFTDRWFVHALVDEGSGQAYQPLAAGIYLGLATPWLALSAIRRGRIERALAIVAVGSLLVALGRHAPLWQPFFRFVPGARLFRYPEKYLFVTTVCLVALAARGLPSVLAHPRWAAQRALTPLALLTLGFALVTVRGPALMQALVGRLGAVTPEEAGQVALGRATLALATGLLLAAPLALAAAGRLSPRALARLWPALLVADLFAASVHLLDWSAPASLWRDRPPIADDLFALAGPTLAPLRLYRPEHLDLTQGGLPELERATLEPNLGGELGLDHLDAYDVFHTPRETALWATLRSRPLALLRVTATHFALLGDGQLGAVHPGLTVRRPYPRLHASLVEVAAAADRAYLAREARPAGSPEEAARAILQPDFIAGATAVVEGGEPRHAEGQCTLEAFAAESIALGCEASQPSYAILSEAWFPGWSATVDGTAAPILPANAAMRAVPVPAGRSQVLFRYRPRGLGAAAIGSVLGLLLAAILIRRRTR